MAGMTGNTIIITYKWRKTERRSFGIFIRGITCNKKIVIAKTLF